MSFEICPYCKDFSEQTKLAELPGEHSFSSGVDSVLHLSICHSCGKTVEHEEIIVQTVENHNQRAIIHA